MEHTELIYRRIMQDMSEGVLTLGFDGAAGYVNPAAERILGKSAAEIRSRSFLRALLEDAENDAFAQTVLDAVYDKENTHDEIVDFRREGAPRKLHMVTSFLRDGSEPVGVIVVLDDITELAELKIEYAAQIASLLDSLVGALSAAIDERSAYNANHSRSMAVYAGRFLDWLERTGNPWAFDENRRRAFLMSVMLHDVGKLAVPLEVMDKATRLGARLEAVLRRLTEIGLLDRIAMLEGRITAEELERRNRERVRTRELVERLDRAGYLSDEDLAAVNEAGGRTYVDENGETRPWLTGPELDALRVRRGTLTGEERAVMESHVVLTERILSRVRFPEMYAEVPLWAAEHHELLNGKGYPRRLRGREIPREARLLTILDVFDALTARDRPYKPALPPEKALEILRGMAEEGAVDEEILDLFAASGAWEDAGA